MSYLPEEIPLESVMPFLRFADTNRSADKHFYNCYFVLFTMVYFRINLV